MPTANRHRRSRRRPRAVRRRAPPCRVRAHLRAGGPDRPSPPRRARPRRAAAIASAAAVVVLPTPPGPHVTSNVALASTSLSDGFGSVLGEGARWSCRHRRVHAEGVGQQVEFGGTEPRGGDAWECDAGERQQFVETRRVVDAGRPFGDARTLRTRRARFWRREITSRPERAPRPMATSAARRDRANTR